MREHLKQLVLPLTACGMAVILLVWWLGGTSTGDVQPRLPDQDGVPSDSNSSTLLATPPVAAGEPRSADGKPSSLVGQWTGFRGNHRDGIADDGVRLARTWPSDGPPVLWSVTLGEGYAGAAISGGCAYVLDYDEAAAADTLRCLSLDDGREVWRNSYPVQLTRNHGMSRTVPTVVGDRIITMGPRCHVACWNAQTGQCHWLIDLVRDYKATVPQWYSGQCPLVDQGRVILAPCSNSLLMAVDLGTGDVIWESPNPRNWQMTHASIMPMQYGGQQTYLVCGSGGVAAIAADDGSIQWDSTEWPITFATCPSPLVLPEGRIFLCSGYGRTVGSLLLEVQTTEGGPLAKPVLELTPQQFNAEHHTPILYGGHIYGVRKRGGGQLVCLDLQGQEVWNSGTDRFGHGPYMIADGLILVMDDRGELSMAEATSDAYQRRGRFAVFPDGHDAWGPMALAGGRLIVRDMTRMACLDLAER